MRYLNLKSIAYLSVLMFLFGQTYGQTMPTYFVELNTGVLCYKTEEVYRPVNPTFGIVSNIDFGNTVSFEVFYSNAWIDEEIKFQTDNYAITSRHYQIPVNWFGFRIGFGKNFENWSLHGLIGLSGLIAFESERGGLESSIRFSRNFTSHLSINGSINTKWYRLKSYHREEDLYPENVLATHYLFSAQIGVGYHFTVKQNSE